MVVTKIFMGLGNQMFQYAAGKALALEKNVPLKLEVSSYEGYSMRKFELDTFFALNSEKVTKEEVAKYEIRQAVKSVWNKVFPHDRMYFYKVPYEESQIKRRILQVTKSISPAHKKRTYIQPYYHFDPSFFKASDDVFLIGYWMSWKYFEKFDKEIRQDFKIRHELVSHLSEIENEIAGNNSVSIHIRRGDFISEKNALLHGVIPIEFYKKAIEAITQKTSSAHFYVFSDDIGWVKENLKTELPMTFISSEITQAAVEDFYLMSICKHNIIANSTFSWWAAYLNNNAGKVVIAPEKWYNKTIYNYKDVYPPSWTLLN